MQCHNGSGFMDDVVLETMVADEKSKFRVLVSQCIKH